MRAAAASMAGKAVDTNRYSSPSRIHNAPIPTAMTTVILRKRIATAAAITPARKRGLGFDMKEPPFFPNYCDWDLDSSDKKPLPTGEVGEGF